MVPQPPVPAWLVRTWLPHVGVHDQMSWSYCHYFQVPTSKEACVFDVSGLPELLKGLIGDSLTQLLHVPTCNGGTVPKTKMSVLSLPHESNTVIHVAFSICISDLFHKLLATKQ